MFNFQHSQIPQTEFEKLAGLLLKYPTVFATSKFDVGKIKHYLSTVETRRTFQKLKSK